MLLPVLGCAEASAPKLGAVVTRLAEFDFEESSFLGRGARTDQEPYSGQWSGVLSNAGNRKASAWSPLIRIGTADRVRVDFWADLRGLNGGAASIYYHGFEDTVPEHPAMPPQPLLVQTGRITSLDGEPEWTSRRGSFSTLDGRITSLRIEFRLEMAFRVDGWFAYDDVVVRGVTNKR